MLRWAQEFDSIHDRVGMSQSHFREAENRRRYLDVPGTGFYCYQLGIRGFQEQRKRGLVQPDQLIHIWSAMALDIADLDLRYLPDRVENTDIDGDDIEMVDAQTCFVLLRKVEEVPDVQSVVTCRMRSIHTRTLFHSCNLTD